MLRPRISYFAEMEEGQAFASGKSKEGKEDERMVGLRHGEDRRDEDLGDDSELKPVLNSTYDLGKKSRKLVDELRTVVDLGSLGGNAVLAVSDVIVELEKKRRKLTEVQEEVLQCLSDPSFAPPVGEVGVALSRKSLDAQEWSVCLASMENAFSQKRHGHLFSKKVASLDRDLMEGLSYPERQRTNAHSEKQNVFPPNTNPAVVPTVKKTHNFDNFEDSTYSQNSILLRQQGAHGKRPALYDVHGNARSNPITVPLMRPSQVPRVPNAHYASLNDTSLRIPRTASMAGTLSRMNLRTSAQSQVEGDPRGNFDASISHTLEVKPDSVGLGKVVRGASHVFKFSLHCIGPSSLRFSVSVPKSLRILNVSRKGSLAPGMKSVVEAELYAQDIGPFHEFLVISTPDEIFRMEICAQIVEANEL